jgi:hypothetical protein
VFCLAYTPTVALTLLFAATVYRVPGAVAHSGSQSDQPFWVDLATSAGAGFSEEIAILAFPIVLVAALRPDLGRGGTRVLVAVLVALRLSYHLEYGIAALALLPWALLSAIVYLRTRALVPLVLAHITYDVLLAVDLRVEALAGAPARWLLLPTVCATAWWAVLRRARSESPGSPPRFTPPQALNVGVEARLIEALPTRSSQPRRPA